MKVWVVVLFSNFIYLTAHNNKPIGLLCNLLANPELTVITTPIPQFGWIIPTGSDNRSQTAYRILVSSSISKLNNNIGDMWDSKKQVSNQSQHIRYGGNTLQSWSSYYWKVAFWDEQDQMSHFSEPQQFNTGDFECVRVWPGESRWVNIKKGDSVSWTFEDRSPIQYHKKKPEKTIHRLDGTWFLDFATSSFAYCTFWLEWPKTAENYSKEKVINVRIGEKAIGDSIDRKPGGGVLFKEYPLTIKPGKHEYTLKIPPFVSNYPHSQVMPEHMREVIPFRFCEIDGNGTPIRLLSAIQYSLHTVFNDNSASFSSSSQLLNEIYNLCKYSIKVNTFNGDYAASQRERMMYEADSYIHQMGHYAVDREYSVARYSLKNMIFHATWPTEWIFHTIMMAWADYMHTGDKEVIEMFYEELKPKTLSALTTKNGLISTRTGLQSKEFLALIHFNGKELRDIVDWPHGSMSHALQGGETDNFDFRDYNTVVNAFHYHSLVLMSRIADAIGKSTDATQYAKQASTVKQVFHQNFYDKTRGIYVDGIGTTHASLHSNMFALVFGLIPEFAKETVLTYIKSKGMACGVYGANYLLEALFDSSEADHALSLLTSTSDRSWHNMIRIGSTMTTEAWDNKYKSNNGWSHAWSSSPAHILPRKLMGVEPITPGFETFKVKPAISSLKEVEIKLPTIRGEIKAKYIKTTNSFKLSVSVPGNTKAQVYLPIKRNISELLLNNIPISKYEIDDRYVVINNIGSGEHRFEIKFEPVN